MHGSKWRREETNTSRLRRAVQAPPADPTTPIGEPRVRAYEPRPGRVGVVVCFGDLRIERSGSDLTRGRRTIAWS